MNQPQTIAGVSLDEIVHSLQSKGYVIIPNFLGPEQVSSLKEILHDPHKLNSNELSSVYRHDSVFFSNAAAYSKTAFDILTSPNVRLIAQSYLGNNIRLKCHRIYSTWRDYKFPWHTDNKIDGDKIPAKGLAFIIYLIDTANGATQLASGSHKVSHEYASNNFTDTFMQKAWGDKIITAAGKAGDLVLSDIQTIHRGSYWTGKPSKRISFWFQIDANTDKAERLLINPVFMPPNPSQGLLDFLGFGKGGGDLRVHPAETSSLKVFPLHALVRIFFESIAALIYYPFKIVRMRLSDEFKVKLRKLLRLRNDWN